MLEATVGVLFCAALFISVGFGWSIVPALLFGLIVFLGYGLMRAVSLPIMLRRAVQSVAAAGTILMTFVLIGVLTSLWRASGTIAFIVAHSATAVHSATVLPLTFVLCAGMSILTGSSFASMATMGTICMSLGLAMGTGPMWLGGAILAGIYVGDRCSPVSTSALLVAQLTHTNLFDNISHMLRTGAIPFILSCLIYAIASVSGVAVTAGASHSGTASTANDVIALFASSFQLHWTTLIPALLVILLALLRIDVRLTMLASIAASIVVCVGVQHMGWRDLLMLIVSGYHATNPRVGALLDGGGVLSMVNVAAIVCISAAYAGVFAETHMLARLQHAIGAFARRAGATTATVVTAACMAALACNQTLTIMLTHQLCAGLHDNDARHAIDLEDSAVVISPMIPWSIAGAVPLATVGAPTSSILVAVFLYVLPLTRVIADLWNTMVRKSR
ncbi:sodium:proton antiporter [Bifidobacterium goeldii]|uniref:Sodium:proton antiporter n=1 Tax=Bifidobacterium goeldii TaxID=2306975 RepID=A0A430FJL4_9BIFI|nr:Na+/H+ antiporter NhaC family protein [Bifidobacterium goeldii]RSX53085.1 sodium:proton antiporter [Bifidobacterium goeldii]